MKLAIMQPYFFPYLGYFDLLNIVDEWIVFDTSQYVRRSWMNRNRILKPDNGWQYITIPVQKHHQQTPYNQILVSESDWDEKILRQLDHYKKGAPYYKDVISLLEDCFSNLPENLTMVNTILFEKTAHYLGIKKPIYVFSEMNLDLEIDNVGKSDWSWVIAHKVNAKEYINRPGGKGFINEPEFLKRGIKLTFQDFENMVYSTGKAHQFESGLSIIDVMMWNSPAEIKNYLDTWRK